MLPELFLKRMEEMLGEEYGAFLESLGQERYQALRLNPLKCHLSGQTAAQAVASQPAALQAAVFRAGGSGLPFTLSRVPWEENGYYYEKQDQPGRHPFHEAGVYYIQEPSAMAVAPLLEARPGERILDLCAAPGGKSTQIAAAMGGQGLLLANEIHPARAKILSENIERMGVANACVTNETPERLAERFPEYFDRILVDAPCSGEGMFRKNEEACKEWSPENVALCAGRQDGILDCAAGMLRPGGRMVYSTCTFAREEDEGSVERFLQRHSDFVLREFLRLWPHKIKGEGHFAAVLEKAGAPESAGELYRSVPPGGLEKGIPEKELGEYRAFLEETLKKEVWDGAAGVALCPAGKKPAGGIYQKYGDNLYLVPQDMPSLKGLKVLRPGLHLGTLKKNRFEPSHALALFLSGADVLRMWNLDADGEQVRAYLNGQTFPAEGGKGWYLICVDGYSLGWGKLAGGIMKNHYPKGLRIQREKVS